MFPNGWSNNRATFGHTVSDGVGKAYLFEERFYFGIERSTTDNDFIEVPTEDSIAACRANDLILSFTMGTLSNSLPILLSTLGRISFLIIFSTIKGTQEITLGFISAKTAQ